MDGRLFLRDEELDSGAALILLAEKSLVAAADTAMSEAGLSRGEFDVLMNIRAQPGLAVSEIRARLGMTVPTFARLLGQLDQRNLIDKTRSGRDARARLLHLSADGKALAEPIAEALRRVLRPAFREAGAEQVAGARSLLEALTREDRQ